MAVHRQCWHASSARSSRRASTRTRDPNPTTAVISSTSGVGADVMIRRTLGLWPVASIGPSCLIRWRVCSVVQGLSCVAGLDPASVSARTWANWLGHAGGSPDVRSPGSDAPGSGSSASGSSGSCSPAVGSPCSSSPGSPSGPAGGASPASAAAPGGPAAAAAWGSSSYGGAASGTATRRTATGSGGGAPRPGGRRRVGGIGATSGRAGGWRVGNGNSGGRFSCMSGVLLGPGDISGGRNAAGAKLVLVCRGRPRLPRNLGSGEPQCHCHHSSSLLPS
jgi:hypothetical protein